MSERQETATLCADCGGHLRREYGTYEFEDGTVTSTFILVCQGECRRRYLPEQVFGARNGGITHYPETPKQRAERIGALADEASRSLRLTPGQHRARFGEGAVKAVDDIVHRLRQTADRWVRAGESQNDLLLLDAADEIEMLRAWKAEHMTADDDIVDDLRLMASGDVAHLVPDASDAMLEAAVEIDLLRIAVRAANGHLRANFAPLSAFVFSLGDPELDAEIRVVIERAVGDDDGR